MFVYVQNYGSALIQRRYLQRPVQVLDTTDGVVEEVDCEDLIDSGIHVEHLEMSPVRRVCRCLFPGDKRVSYEDYSWLRNVFWIGTKTFRIDCYFGGKPGEQLHLVKLNGVKILNYLAKPGEPENLDCWVSFVGRVRDYTLVQVVLGYRKSGEPYRTHSWFTVMLDWQGKLIGVVPYEGDWSQPIEYRYSPNIAKSIRNMLSGCVWKGF